jgi:hypothetical protein
MKTVGRITLSLVTDSIGFLAGGLVTEAAIGAAIGGVPVVGPIAAGTVALAGGILISYGVSTMLSAIKETLGNSLFGRLPR